MKLFVILSLFLLLLGRFNQYFVDKPQYTNGQDFNLQTVIGQNPELSNLGQKFSIKDRYYQTVFVTASSFPRFHTGQVIRIQGKMQVKKTPDGRVVYGLFSPQITVSADAENIFAGAAEQIRNFSEDLYTHVLPTQSASLLMGIVFGTKEQFSDAFYAYLQATGVLHVIAASGMNVTFVASALIFLLGRIMKRQFALLLACSGILFYVVIVGLQPSILRAAIMALFTFGASLFGRQNIAVVAVCLSGYLMLLWQPGYLFDVGFQLSFMATIGILFGKQLIPITENVWTEAFTTTTAAQLGTVPILIGVFGKVGIYSLLVNGITLWTVPILMVLGSLAVVVGFVIEPLGRLILLFALPFLLFFEEIVTLFGKLGGVYQIPPIPWTFALSYYLFLAVLVLKKERSLNSNTFLRPSKGNG